MRKNTHIKTRHGNALVFVIILFAMISILALAVLSVAATESNLVRADIRRDQAYYIARSAVESTYQWIFHNVHSDTQLNKVIPPSGEVWNSPEADSFINGNPYRLEIWRDDANSDLIHVRSRATVNGVSSTAQMSFVLTISSFVLFEDAIYAYDGFGKVVGNADIYNGDVSTALKEYSNNAFNFHPNTYELITDKDIRYPQVSIPSSVVFNLDLGDFVIDQNNNSELDEYEVLENTRFDSLFLNGDLILNSIAGDDIYIHVKGDLIIGNKAHIIQKAGSTGRIFFFVDGSIRGDKNKKETLSVEVQGLTNNDPSSPSYPQPLLFFIFNDNSNNLMIEMAGNPSLNAYIYAPYTSITFAGGGNQDNVVGAIIARQFNSNGGFKVYYIEPELDNSPFSILIDSESFRAVTNQRWRIPD